ncbi:MAG: hypothetical protein PT977_06275 [Acidobacteriota bacterium]|nr:hypothetical protein [Acidobacteriota bacterium]
MKPAVRAVLLATIASASTLVSQGALACPTCAGSASKGPDIWPLVGLFMLVPWILAVGAVWLIRRESRAA